MTTFKPKGGSERRPTAAEIDATARLPRREAFHDEPSEDDDPPTEMIGIRYDRRVIRRFKKMAKDDRRTYGDMLEILMDAYEDRAG